MRYRSIISDVLVGFGVVMVWMCRGCYGDLPIHALLADVKGEWTFHMTKAEFNSPDTCGSSLPNKNSQNLRTELSNYLSYLTVTHGGIHSKVTYRLSTDAVTNNQLQPSAATGHRSSWTFLAVYDEQNQLAGDWTVVYDEGFQVKTANRRFVAFFKYLLKESCTFPQDGDAEGSNGYTKCYSTDPSQTHIGWYTERRGETEPLLFGCFYAHKTNAHTTAENFVAFHTQLTKDNSPLHAYYTTQEFVQGHNQLQDTLWRAAEYDNFKAMESENLERYFKNLSNRRIWRRNTEVEKATSLLEVSSSKATQTAHGCTCPTAPEGIQTLAETAEAPVRPHQHEAAALPPSFSWGDPFTNTKQAGGNQTFPPAVNQGNCGSCYTLAFTYVLQHRFNIAANKLLHTSKDILPPLSSALSAQFILSCSHFNQGCDGGYPFLAAATAADIGIPESTCMQYEADHNVKCAIPFRDKKKRYVKPHTECSDSQRWYVKDYGYVGGCYECGGCKGEQNIMQEIYNNGPVVAAFDAPRSLLAYYNGIFDIQPDPHSRVCDDPSGAGGSLAGWEFTNHAVAIVGWGEELQNGADLKKYWIVRNTWGSNWGQSGYFKLIRGNNLGGIENQVVWVDPDFSRGKGKEAIKNVVEIPSTLNPVTPHHI